MDASLVSLAQGRGRVSDTMDRVLTARAVNQALGGAFVGPWDVDELDEGTLAACLGLAMGLPKAQRGTAEVERMFAENRARHGTYRK